MVVRATAKALLVRPSLLNDIVRHTRDLRRLHRRATITELATATTAALLLVAALRLRLRTNARHTRACRSLRLHRIEHCALDALIQRCAAVVVDLHLIRARRSAMRRG